MFRTREQVSRSDGLEATDLGARGAPTEEIIQGTISHLSFPILPGKSHLGCTTTKRI